MIFNLSKKRINGIFFLLQIIVVSTLLFRLKTHFNASAEPMSQVLTFANAFSVIFISLLQLLVNLTVKEHQEETEKTSDELKTEEMQKETGETVDQKTENKTEKKSSLQHKEMLAAIVPGKLPSVEEFGESLLINLSQHFDIVQGVVHSYHLSENKFFPVSYYAYFSETKPEPFKVGETLPGQAARNKEILILDNIPENYVQVISGLGESIPDYLIMIPVVKDDVAIGIIELASFKAYDEEQLNVLKEIGNKVSTTLNSYVKSTEKNTDKTKDGKEQTK